MAMTHELRKLVEHLLLVLLQKLQCVRIHLSGLLCKRRRLEAVRVRAVGPGDSSLGTVSSCGHPVAGLDGQLSHIVQHFTLLGVDRRLARLHRSGGSGQRASEACVCAPE